MSSLRSKGAARALVRNLSAFCLAALFPLAAADAASLETVGAAQVNFSATGPAGLSIEGKSDSLSGRVEDGKLVLVAGLGKLKTGIDLRDKHLREHLETQKFPSAKLSIDVAKLEKPGDKAKVAATRNAELTLHGVTKPLKIEYEARRTGSDLHVTGETEIDIRDFEVKVPCYLGVCVRPKVGVSVRFKLREK